VDGGLFYQKAPIVQIARLTFLPPFGTGRRRVLTSAQWYHHGRVWVDEGRSFLLSLLYPKTPIVQVARLTFLPPFGTGMHRGLRAPRCYPHRVSRFGWMGGRSFLLSFFLYPRPPIVQVARLTFLPAFWEGPGYYQRRVVSSPEVAFWVDGGLFYQKAPIVQIARLTFLPPFGTGRRRVLTSAPWYG